MTDNSSEKSVLIGGQERTVTRVFCGIIGVLFVGTPVFPLFIYEHQRQELLCGSTEFLVKVGLMYVGIALFGLIALFIAVAGRAPAWLVRAMSK
jgi:hypothetical protein